MESPSNRPEKADDSYRGDRGGSVCAASSIEYEQALWWAVLHRHAPNAREWESLGRNPRLQTPS